MRRLPNKLPTYFALAALSAITFLALTSVFYLFNATNNTESLRSLKSNPLLVSEFESFINRNNKHYLTKAEKDMRFTIFAQNYQKIQQINSEGHPFTLGINFLADLTEEEYRLRYLKTSKSTGLVDDMKEHVSNVHDDVVIDYRKIVGRVKDQGTCGSCWTFGAIGALEFVYAVNHGNVTTEFSEQHFVDCCRYTDSNGCEGGEKDDAFDFAQVNGMVLESDYPYVALDNPCNTSKNIVFKSSGAGRIPAGNNDELLARLKVQAIDIGINAAPFNFRFFMGGVLTAGCTYTEIDHDVLLLGTDVFPINNTPYWNIKNSWGRNWGDDGYLRILREAGTKPALCGMNMDAGYPLYGNIQ